MTRSRPTAHVILLTGLPGSGKLTVATHLASLLRRRGSVVRVVDNHSVYDVIVNLLPVEDVTSLDPDAWSAIEAVREVVFNTVENLSPASWTILFTEHLEPGDEWFVDRIESIAAKRRSSFIPVRLACELSELERRVVSRERASRLKSTSIDETRRLFAESRALDIRHPNSLTLDNTSISAELAATRIVDHLDAKG
jgi:energy-coupling factor transporter ATP-binding protein EcfA2